MAETSGTPAPRRMQLTGLHHVTLIVADLTRSTAFYRDTLGLALVKEEANPDDPGARHFWFGDAAGTPGTLVSCLEYPALEVGSPDEQLAWRDWLRSRGVECTDVLERGGFSSIYVHDPDGHVVEIATRARGGAGSGSAPAAFSEP